MPSIRFLSPVAFLLLGGVALVACPSEEDPCQTENHCLRDGDSVRCENGYEWENPDDRTNYNCVEEGTGGGDGDGDGDGDNAGDGDGDGNMGDGDGDGDVQVDASDLCALSASCPPPEGFSPETAAECEARIQGSVAYAGTLDCPAGTDAQAITVAHIECANEHVSTCDEVFFAPPQECQGTGAALIQAQMACSDPNDPDPEPDQTGGGGSSFRDDCECADYGGGVATCSTSTPNCTGEYPICFHAFMTDQGECTKSCSENSDCPGSSTCRDDTFPNVCDP